jgi:outer membrane protein assembly factor BamB
MRCKAIRIAATVMLLCLPVAVFGQEKADVDWPTFHGPQRDNVSTETGLLKAWPAAGPPLVWTASGLGQGWSTVSVAGGVIYTAGKVGDGAFVFAFKLDGTPLWKAANGGDWEAPEGARWARGYAGSRATPTIDDGLVYHMSGLGRLAAFDIRDGKEVWALDLPKQFNAKRAMWGYAESVLINGDRLICSPGGTKGRTVALNKKTGDVIWAATEPADGPSYCSAVIVKTGDVRQIISVNAAAVYALDAGTSALLWRHAFTNKRGINAVTPVHKDGILCVSTGYGRGSIGLELTADGKTVKARQLWEIKLLDSQHGGTIGLGGFVYGSGDQQRGWFCIEMQTGKRMWRADGVGKGAVSMADGLLYCLSEGGALALVRPTPEKYVELSRFTVPNGGAGKHWAHPVISGGRLYLRHADKLFAYDIRAK